MQNNAQKPKGQCPIVFLSKNNRTISKQTQNFSKPWENDSTSLNQEENARNDQFFTLEDEEDVKSSSFKL